MKKLSIMRLAILLILFSVLMVKCGKTGKTIQPSPMVRLHPAVVMKPLPDGLGVNIHFYEGSKNDWKMLSAAGVGIVRMDVGWGGSEKKPGQYQFAHYDTLVSRLEKYGMRLLFILDYGNALYDEGQAPKSDSALAAYARFAGALAKRYKGKPILWELWNEPNSKNFWLPKANVDQYMKWCRAVVPAIRLADPKACIVGPATSRIDFRFLENTFTRGLLKWVDGVTVHPYRSPSLGPETALPDYYQLRVLIKRYKPVGKIIPIISGEWGYSTTGLSRELQAKYLARQWLSNLAFGVPISIWYDWHDDGQDPTNSEHNFGTVTYDYKPKPAYLAMKTLIWELKAFLPASRIGVGNASDFVVPFVHGEEVKLAVWTVGAPHLIDLGQEISFTRAKTGLGKAHWLPGRGRVFASDMPQYVTVSRPVPEWLKLAVQISKIGNKEVQDVAESILSHRQPQTPFGKAFYQDYKKGSVKENRIALHVLAAIAGRLKDSRKAVAIYRLVLNNQSDNVDKEKAIYGLAALGVTDSMREISELENVPELQEAVAFFRMIQARNLLEAGDFASCKKILVETARGSHLRYFLDQTLEGLKQKGALPDEEIRKISKQVGFVNRWWVAGPFPNLDDVGQKTAYFPEQKVDFGQTQAYEEDTARWQKVQSKTIQGIVPFAKLFGRKRGVAYAYAELNAPRKKWVQFKIGSNDGVVCWVNGKKVHQNFVGRSLTIDEDKVNVRLKKGTNKILLKVLNHGANWEACLRVCNSRGKPLDISDWLATPGF